MDVLSRSCPCFCLQMTNGIGHISQFCRTEILTHPNNFVSFSFIPEKVHQFAYRFLNSIEWLLGQFPIGAA